MKILQVTAAYKPAYVYGGPTMSVAMLCEQLVYAGIEVTVFTTTANGTTELDVIPGQPVLVDGVNVTYFKRVTKDHSHLSPALLKAVWKNAKNYHVIHIHAWWNLVSVLGCLVALLRGVPVVVSARGTLSPYSFQNKNQGIKSLIHKLLGVTLLKRCHIHATSQRENVAVNRIVKPKSTTTIPNFVKLPAYHLQHQPELLSPIKFIFFSRVEEKKGLNILIDALAKVHAPFQLTVAGDGSDEYVASLKTLAIGKRVADKITWLGFISEDKFEVLQRHDLFILPSYDENFGNAVIESLSVGTAVLISEEVGLAEYVQKNKLGWLCQTNAGSVAEAISAIVDRPEELNRIQEQAPNIIYNDFGTVSLVEKYKHLYQEIAPKN